jgi:hypothetical protein
VPPLNSAVGRHGSVTYMKNPFRIEVEVFDSGPRTWPTAQVNIFHDREGASLQIGSYKRNHAGWCVETFSPFYLDGQWYALYSPDYTATRLMTLPSCQDLGGEEPHTHGFCPVDFYVPYDQPHVVSSGHAGRFGFVAGCIWGDDSSWKIQYLDLSDAASGKLVRKEMFGYVSMPDRAKRLSECVSVVGYTREYPHIALTVSQTYDISRGMLVDPFA